MSPLRLAEVARLILWRVTVDGGQAYRVAPTPERAAWDDGAQKELATRVVLVTRRLVGQVATLRLDLPLALYEVKLDERRWYLLARDMGEAWLVASAADGHAADESEEVAIERLLGAVRLPVAAVLRPLDGDDADKDATEVKP